jgi:hypothetical protein
MVHLRQVLLYLHYKVKFILSVTDHHMTHIALFPLFQLPIVLSVALKHPETAKEIGSYTFDLAQPLITQAHLWFNCSRLINT